MLLNSLLTIIAPVFVVIAVGALLAAFFKFDLSALNRVALYATVPALVFTSLVNTQLTLLSAGRLVAAYTVFMILMLLVARLAFGSFDKASRRGLMTTSAFANSANMMLPITLFAFGPEGLERALILYVLTTVMMFFLAPIVLTGRGATSFERVLRLPVLWAALLGLGLNLLNWQLPTALNRGIALLSEAAVPLVLLVLGMQIQRTGLQLPTLHNWLGTAMKLLVAPVLAYLVARGFGATGLDLAILTLLAAMPPAVNTFMLALEFGADSESVARTVVLSTLTSLFTLSVIVTVIMQRVA